MTTQTAQHLEAYRRSTFHLDPASRLHDVDQALAFVEARGFVFLWPIHDHDLPSLWTAVAGDRPVAAEHDDPGHVTWGWKDQMLDKRRWYYGKLLRGKATLVSLATLPHFYALSERVADLDDYRLAYHEGHLTYEAYQVAEVLRLDGPQHTIELRRRAHLSAPESKARFNKALSDLQRGLWILPIGVARAGAWRYAFRYELLDRWLPQVPKQARPLTTAEARRHLLGLYLDSVGAAPQDQARRLFQWPSTKLAQAFTALQQQERARLLADGRWETTKVSPDGL